MGYETPAIDRIARERIRFLHYYAESPARQDAPPFSRASTVFAPA
jgi:hypothetical protein